MRPHLSPHQRRDLFRKEISSYIEFFIRQDKTMRELVFYSAQAQYISFFEGVLNELCAHNTKLSYITSDHDDPILTRHQPNITPFHFDDLFPFVLPFLDAKVVVMTMPDLNLFHVRRSVFDTNHVYLFHSLMSTHMGFRPGGLDHFDTILCAGPHHKEEILRTEKLYKLKPKLLLETGYYRLEKIYADHQHYQNSHPPQNTPPLVLIAPSGHTTNITATCGIELTGNLLAAGFQVVFRPHPMTIYKKPEQIRSLTKAYSTHPQFLLDVETVSEKYLHQADVMISDWSGVALEYAFGTERPVLFIDSPKRQQNPEFQRLGIPPAEIFLRDKIGQLIRLDEIPRAGHVIHEFLAHKDEYRDAIRALRTNFVYHFGNSSKIGADQILKILSGESTNTETT